MTEMNATAVKSPVLTELTPEMFSDATGPDFVELTLAHRCDACSAAAVAQVEISDDLPHLLLCGHHYRANMDHIADMGYAFEVEEEHSFKFTDREISARPRTYTPRDAGSAL